MADVRTAPETVADGRLEEIATHWLTRLRILHRAHEKAATIYARRGVILSVAILTLASIVGTSIFASINSSPSTTWKIITALLSLGAAVLAAFQAFLVYPELADHHRQAAAKVASLKRRLDLIAASGPIDSAVLEDVRVRWERISEDAPAVPGRLYKRAEHDISRRSPGPALRGPTS